MALRYHLCSVVLVTSLVLASAGLRAQGDTCTTALQVVTGIHLANGPGTGSPGPGCGGGNNGDWYLYTPSFTGTITISSCHPLNTMVDDDTYLKVFTGTCDDLTCVAFNDDGGPNFCPDNLFASFLEVDVVAGESYYIVWTNLFDSNSFYWELNECMGTVTGVTYFDNNGNATRDLGEAQVDVMLFVQPEGAYAYAGQDPYSFCSDAGAHTITVPNPPLYHTAVPVSRSYDIFAQGVQVTGADFAFQSIPGVYDASVSLWGWNPWIGNNTTLHVNYANIGTETVNATVSLTLDALHTYVSATTTATTVAGQTITWAVGPLAAGTNGSITVTINTSSSATPNAPVLNTVSITTVESDIAPANNVDELHSFCTTSFDPNDKQVDLVTLTPTEVADQQKLEYTVRFQNTGTAPAVNVVIRDMLDSDLDLSTFEMVGASHPYSLSILNGEAMWVFENILLPASSTDEMASQGALHYRVAPKANLIVGDQVTNRADIYFDYNEPVLTNTVVTEVALSTGIAEVGRSNGLLVHPSPGQGPISIRWMNASVDGARLTILDALGRSVRTIGLGRLNPSGVETIDLSDLPNGTYAAWLQGDKVDAKTRFVIQH